MKNAEINKIKHEVVVKSAPITGFFIDYHATNMQMMDTAIACEVCWDVTAKYHNKITDFFALVKKVCKYVEFDDAYDFAQSAKSQGYAARGTYGYAEIGQWYPIELGYYDYKKFNNPLA